MILRRGDGVASQATDTVLAVGKGIIIGIHSCDTDQQSVLVIGVVGGLTAIPKVFGLPANKVLSLEGIDRTDSNRGQVYDFPSGSECIDRAGTNRRQIDHHGCGSGGIHHARGKLDARIADLNHIINIATGQTTDGSFVHSEFKSGSRSRGGDIDAISGVGIS